MDARVRRGADVSSDHHLVTATLKLKLRRARKRTTGHQQLDVERLSDPRMKSYFVLHLKNRFQALTALTGTEEYTQTDTDEVNTKWEQVKKACSESSEACRGFK